MYEEELDWMYIPKDGMGDGPGSCMTNEKKLQADVPWVSRTSPHSRQYQKLARSVPSSEKGSSEFSVAVQSITQRETEVNHPLKDLANKGGAADPPTREKPHYIHREPAPLTHLDAFPKVRHQATQTDDPYGFEQDASFYMEQEDGLPRFSESCTRLSWDSEHVYFTCPSPQRLKNRAYEFCTQINRWYHQARQRWSR